MNAALGGRNTVSILLLRHCVNAAKASKLVEPSCRTRFNDRRTIARHLKFQDKSHHPGSYGSKVCFPNHMRRSVTAVPSPDFHVPIGRGVKLQVDAGRTVNS